MKNPEDEIPTPQQMREKPMGFWDHVDELRGTIIKSVAVFALFVGLIGYNLKAFYNLLLWPFQHAAADYPKLDLHLGTTTMTEGFNVIFQVCMLGGMMLSAPFILFFIGQFVAPALTRRETKALLPLCTAACVLFMAGAAFAFFVLMPAAVKGTIRLNEFMDWEIRWTVGGYYTVLTRTLLGVGGTFEFPLVIVLLSWLGLVSSTFLRKYRRHAIVAVFVISAIVTPTEEPMAQCLMAAPLYVLFEIGVAIAARMEKNRERSAAAVLLALLALWPRKRPTVHALDAAPAA